MLHSRSESTAAQKVYRIACCKKYSWYDLLTASEKRHLQLV
jgi:hypothetical protein